MTALTTGPVAPRAATTGTESQLLRFAPRADATATLAFTAVTVGFACLQYLGVRRPV